MRVASEEVPKFGLRPPAASARLPFLVRRAPSPDPHLGPLAGTTTMGRKVWGEFNFGK